MTNILITTHVPLQNGNKILPPGSKIYDHVVDNGQLKLFVIYDNSKEGHDEYEFRYIEVNQTINVDLDQYLYLGKVEIQGNIKLVFMKFISSQP